MSRSALTCATCIQSQPVHVTRVFCPPQQCLQWVHCTSSGNFCFVLASYLYCKQLWIWGGGEWQEGREREKNRQRRTGRQRGERVDRQKDGGEVCVSVCECVHAYVCVCVSVCTRTQCGCMHNTKVAQMHVYMLENVHFGKYTSFLLLLLLLFFSFFIVDPTHFHGLLFLPGLFQACQLCAGSSWRIHGLCPSSVPAVPATTRTAFSDWPTTNTLHLQHHVWLVLGF